MPFKPPFKKGQNRRFVLKLKKDLTPAQRKSFKKSVMALAKRFKASVVR
jgi:hypothetical protein